MVDAERNQTTRRIAAITGLCVLAVVCNVVVPNLFWGIGPPQSLIDVVPFVACGALVAEVCLLGIWCGLSQQPIKYRLPVTAALVLIAACSFSLGLQLPNWGSPNRGMPVEAALLIAGAGFGIYAVMQIPLWLIRRYFRCRIARPETVQFENSRKARQFSVGYLMLWMALVGILLVLVRNSLPEHSSPPSIRELIRLVMSIVVYIGLSSLLCLPCVWIALIERPHSGASLLLVSGLIMGPLLVLVCTNILFGRQDAREMLTGVASFEVGITGATLAVLWVLRLLGFRVLVVRPEDSVV